jgi:hypothetical protein
MNIAGRVKRIVSGEYNSRQMIFDTVRELLQEAVSKADAPDANSVITLSKVTDYMNEKLDDFERELSAAESRK